MVHLTAPITTRQLALLQERKRLEYRLQGTSGYGLAAQAEAIDAELNKIEQGKRGVAA